MFRYVTIAVVIWTVSCSSRQEIGRSRQAVDVTYRFDQPNVNQHVTEFPTIPFQQYDEVTVRAGGCVKHRTRYVTFWTHYVNPQGDYTPNELGSDEFFHGLIWIPGATAGLESIGSIINRGPIFIRQIPPGANPQQLYLRLGYDDDFPNTQNVYDDIQPGYLNQCLGQGPAWVEVDITHHTSPPSLSCPSFPVDMYWPNENGIDVNMLPLNPVWGLQCGQPAPFPLIPGLDLCGGLRVDSASVLTTGNPSCTSHLPIANRNFSTFGICFPDYSATTVHGHADWGYATFTNGTIYYLEYSGADDDFNLEFISDQSSVMTDNTFIQGNIHAQDLEFKKSETTDQMGSVGYWGAFKNSSDTDRRALIDGKPAQVVGLLGIDAKYGLGGKAELHPVLGLAIKVRSVESSGRDTWMVFGRRAGNEGGCGPNIRDSGLIEMRFMLPRTFTPVSSSVVFSSAATLDTTYPGAMLLTLPLPPPLGVVWGEVTIAPVCLPQCGPQACGDPDGCGGQCWTCRGTCCDGICCVQGGLCCGAGQCSPDRCP